VNCDYKIAEHILADDFVGVASDGSHYTKAGEVARTKTAKPEFLSNKNRRDYRPLLRRSRHSPRQREQEKNSMARKAVTFGPIPGYVALAAGKSSPPKISRSVAARVNRIKMAATPSRLARPATTEHAASRLSAYGLPRPHSPLLLQRYPASSAPSYAPAPPR
jgi:hypothetical protein